MILNLFHVSIMGLGLAIHLHWECELTAYLLERTIDLPYSDVASLLLHSNDQIGVSTLILSFFKKSFYLITESTIQVLPGTAFVDDFRLSKDPTMAKAWKERMEPNLEKYNDVTGRRKSCMVQFRCLMKLPTNLIFYNCLGFSAQSALKLLELPNTALYNGNKGIM